MMKSEKKGGLIMARMRVYVERRRENNSNPSLSIQHCNIETKQGEMDIWDFFTYFENWRQ